MERVILIVSLRQNNGRTKVNCVVVLHLNEHALWNAIKFLSQSFFFGQICVPSFGKHQTVELFTYILLDLLRSTGNCLYKCVFPLFLYYLVYCVLQLLLCCIYCSLWAKLQNNGHLFTYHCITMQLPMLLHNNTIAYCYSFVLQKPPPSVPPQGGPKWPCML